MQTNITKQNMQYNLTNTHSLTKLKLWFNTPDWLDNVFIKKLIFGYKKYVKLCMLKKLSLWYICFNFIYFSRLWLEYYGVYYKINHYNNYNYPRLIIYLLAMPSSPEWSYACETTKNLKGHLCRNFAPLLFYSWCYI